MGLAGLGWAGCACWAWLGWAGWAGRSALETDWWPGPVLLSGNYPGTIRDIRAGVAGWAWLGLAGPGLGLAGLAGLGLKNVIRPQKLSTKSDYFRPEPSLGLPWRDLQPKAVQRSSSIQNGSSTNIINLGVHEGFRNPKAQLSSRRVRPIILGIDILFNTTPHKHSTHHPQHTTSRTIV